MRRLLVIDDQPKDLKNAVTVANSLGIEEVEVKNSVPGGLSYLERGLRNELPLPDGIVLDLDFGVDSGFELLRFWHRTPQLARIPILVWSVVDEQRELCSLFGVNLFVSKWEGIGAFRDALGQLTS